jgi:putative flippase GtrA
MAPRFILAASTGLLLNYGLLSLLLSLGMHAAVAQILTTIGVLLWNYVISGIWTFKQKRE